MKILFLVGTAALLAACASPSSEAASSNDALTATALPALAALAVQHETGRPVAGGQALPIYEPDGSAPAFYEVSLAPGWAVVTAGAEPTVVEWNSEGLSPSARFDASTLARMTRLYRLDAAIYVAADAFGRAIGSTSPSLLRIDRSGAQATFVPISADDAIAGFHAARVEMEAAASRATPLIAAEDAPTSCSVPGEVPSYSQLGAHQGANTSGCDSGCGPTAWATVFGWASRRAYENEGADGAFASLFQSGGDDAEAPLSMDDDVGALSMRINHVVKTMCLKGQGMTLPWAMNDVQSMVAPGLTVDVHYNFLMISDNGVRQHVLDALCDGRPAVIGIGSLFGGNGHYPIAKGYANGKFLLEMGWGGNGNGWYDAKTWFAGSIHH